MRTVVLAILAGVVLYGGVATALHTWFDRKAEQKSGSAASSSTAGGFGAAPQGDAKTEATLQPLDAKTTVSNADVRMVVAPLTTGKGVNKEFGHQVAQGVLKGLEDFGAIEPVEETEVQAALKRFGLENEALTPVQWRQLSNQLDAGLVIAGSAARAEFGVRVLVTIVSSRTGEELLAPEFSVGGDRREEAEAASRHIIKAFESDVAYIEAIVLCRKYLLKLENAAVNCAEAVTLRPDAVFPNLFYGLTLWRLQRCDEAVKYLEVARAADPWAEQVLPTLAYCYAQIGDYDRALELQKENLALNPDDVDARVRVARRLERAGDFNAAIEILWEGLERDPENPILALYLAALEAAVEAKQPQESNE